MLRVPYTLAFQVKTMNFSDILLKRGDIETLLESMIAKWKRFFEKKIVHSPHGLRGPHEYWWVCTGPRNIGIERPTLKWLFCFNDKWMNWPMASKCNKEAIASWWCLQEWKNCGQIDLVFVFFFLYIPDQFDGWWLVLCSDPPLCPWAFYLF